jgi:hypothetical protein
MLTTDTSTIVMRTTGVSECLADILKDAIRLWPAGGCFPEFHQQKAPEYGEETETVHKETDGRACCADEQSCDGGPHGPCRVEYGRVERDGVHQIFFPDHFNNKGLARRHVYGVYHAEQGGEDQYVPVLDNVGKIKGREREGEEHQGRLGKNNDLPLWKIIDERSGEEREEQHGQELEGRDDAEFKGRMGQFQHEPCLADVLHPGADERYELSGEEETEVPVAQGAEERLYH